MLKTKFHCLDLLFVDFAIKEESQLILKCPFGVFNLTKKPTNFLKDFFPSLGWIRKSALFLNYLKIIQLGTFLIFSFRISITTKIITLKFSISHFVFSHWNKHLRTLINLLDMATGYANCVLGSDGCNDLQHILKRPRRQSVKRIAPVIKTPITKSLYLESIFGCFCAFLAICALF